VGRWRDYIASLVEIYRGRRDVMVEALSEHFPPQATWTRPAGGLFVWATLPDYIDSSDLLAKALRENVAFVPGQAAYVDGRGHSSMRLNFSGVGEADIREGIGRIGKVVAEQVSLYETLTDTPADPGGERSAFLSPPPSDRESDRASRSDSREGAEAEEGGGMCDADVLPFRKAGEG
jgi:2-aminoadipate transaminase